MLVVRTLPHQLAIVGIDGRRGMLSHNIRWGEKQKAGLRLARLGDVHERRLDGGALVALQWP